MTDALVLYVAGGAADAIRALDGPVSALVRWGGSEERPLGGELLAIGVAGEVAAHPDAHGATTIDLGPDIVLAPGFVNAHTHLDLTHAGPLAYEPESGFFGWIERIRALRVEESDRIRASVRLGIERSLAGGVVAVGDIAGIGRMEPAEELAASPLLGVSFVEYFGLAGGCERSVARASEALATGRVAAERSGVRVGLQPHAPYSAGRALYKGCADLCRACDAPLATHLAESIHERRFIHDGSGHIGPFLAGLGLGDAAEAEGFGTGDTPVQHVIPLLGGYPVLCAHVNDASDTDLDLLASHNASVVYCPRSHRYFGHEADFGRHRWQAMRERGIEVALGTDSIVNIPPGDGDELPALSTLDEARVLWAEGDGEAHTLLDVATCAGARVLGLPAEWFSLSPGPIAGLNAVRVDPSSAGAGSAERVLRATSQPALLHPSLSNREGGA